MKRREFISLISSLTVSQLLLGCNETADHTLTIKLLKSSIPSQLIDKFRKKLKVKSKLEFTIDTQLKTVFSNLEKWQKPPEKQKIYGIEIPELPKLPFNRPEKIPDLVSLGDYWLKPAIANKLIQPIEVKNIPNWSKLPPEFQQIVTRNDQGEIDPNGQIWGIPYSWGSTVIAYNKEKFKQLGWTPTDWADLWRVELSDRISLLNQPREIIGLTLKKLGYSYNTEDLKTVKGLKEELQKLNKQVKLYSSDAYIQPLLLEDTWIAVGWSRELIALSKKDPNIGIIIPASGSTIWADLWVRPTQPEKSPNLDLQNQWLDFYLLPEIANQISLFTSSLSPRLLTMNPTEILPDLSKNTLAIAQKDNFSKSEFLHPLSKDSIKQYRQFWERI